MGFRVKNRRISVNLGLQIFGRVLLPITQSTGLLKRMSLRLTQTIVHDLDISFATLLN